MKFSSFRGAKAGVTLTEVVVTVAILGVLASVIIVGVEASSRVGGEARRIDDAVTVLARLRDASVRYNLGTTFRDTSFTAKISGVTPLWGGVNPGRLSQLTNKITQNDANSCGEKFTLGQVNAWVRNFYSSPISSSTTFRIADGFYANDLLQRFNPSGVATVNASTSSVYLTDPGTLAIVMQNVALSDAQALASRMEGDQTQSVSSVVYFVPSGAAPVTVYYRMEIHGC